MCVDSCVIDVFFSSVTMASKKRYNIASYTSGFSTLPTMPSEKQLKNMKLMMEDLKPAAKEVKELKRKVEELLPVRDETLKQLQETIEDLNEHHFNVNIAKVSLHFMEALRAYHMHSSYII